MSWYGNGPPPENRFYGNLKSDNDTDSMLEEMHKALKEKAKKLEQLRMEEIRRKWPNYADLVEEIKHMEDDMRHREIALDNLREERDLLAKLIGVDDDKT